MQSCQSADSERQRVTFHGSEAFAPQRRGDHLAVNSEKKRTEGIVSVMSSFKNSPSNLNLFCLCFVVDL